MVTVSASAGPGRWKTKKNHRHVPDNKKILCSVCAHRNKGLMFARPESKQESRERLVVPVVGDIKPALEDELEEPGSMVHQPDRMARHNRQMMLQQLRQQAVLDQAAGVRILSSYADRSFDPETHRYKGTFFDSERDPFLKYQQERASIQINVPKFESSKYARGLFDPIRTSPFNRSELRRVVRLNENQRLFEHHEIMAKLDEIEKVWDITKSSNCLIGAPRRFPPLLVTHSLFSRPPLTSMGTTVLVSSLTTSCDPTMSKTFQKTQEEMMMRQQSELKILREATKSSTPPNTPGRRKSATTTTTSGTNSTSRSPVPDEILMRGNMQQVIIAEDDEETVVEEKQSSSSTLPPEIEKRVEQRLANMPVWGSRNNSNLMIPSEQVTPSFNNSDNEQDGHISQLLLNPPTPASAKSPHPTSGSSKSSRTNKKKQTSPPKNAIAAANKLSRLLPDGTRLGSSAFMKRVERAKRKDEMRVKTVTPGLGNMYYPNEVFWEYDPYTKSPIFLHNMVDVLDPTTTTKMFGVDKDRRGSKFVSSEKSYRYGNVLRSSTLASTEPGGESHFSYNDNRKQKRLARKRAKALLLPPIKSDASEFKGLPLYKSFHEPPGRR